MENRPHRKILKSPVAKRRSRLVPKDQKVTLERVLGLTVSNNACLACDPNAGIIAYPAGCVVVLYNPKKNKQSHIFNVSKKTLTSLAFSGDGKHLITGESGHQPAVRVWDVVEKVQVAEFHGHKFGISCVTFSPNLKYIVSIGTQHDMQVNVWNWKTGSKVASNKVSSKVTSVAFSADGSMFVTVGMRHVKFWYLDSSKSKINETVPLSGRNGILGDLRNNFFCDVATGTGRQESKTFCVTQSGYLCQFNEKRQMDKWVEVRTTCASSLSVADDYIFVGGSSGVVRVFDASSLHFIVTLPRPHYLGVDIAAAVSPSQIGATKDVERKYPDTMAVRFDEEHRKVTCVYNDRSMYLWDVHDLKKIGKSWSFLYHSSCVYGIEVYPSLEMGHTPVLPPHSFFTCSSDHTIRIWNLDPHMPETTLYKNNIYSNDLLKVMYMDPSLTSLCDIDYNPSGATDKTDTNYDDKNGIRSIRVSPDGQHLASGDRQGNVRIHDLQNLAEVKQIEAHESEVLCLEYAQWRNGPKILASSSRDRMIHVYDAEQNYGLLQTLSDHSSSIPAIRFTETDGQLKILTCGADKSILFRNLQLEPEFQFTLGHHLVEKMTLYDMDVEPSQKFAAIACQDRNVRIYNVKTGKKKKEYKGSLTDDGTLIKMKLDPSGSYAVTSSSDKNLCILDFYTGELQATMFGHSEIATDARFMNDTKHLLSSAADGCVFVWRLPKEMTEHMQTRLQEMGKTQYMTNGNVKLNKELQDVVDSAPVPQRKEFFSPQRVLKEIYPERYNNAEDSGGGIRDSDSPDYRFSISQLPSWAKKQVGDSALAQTAEGEQGASQAPRGRWAQRAEGQGLTVKQQDGKTVEIDITADRRRFSFEADTLTDVRRETMVLNRPSTTPKNMPVIYDNNMEEEEEDDFMPASSATFVKSESDKPPVSWDDLYSFDNDEVEEEAEIIYYPPSESDGSDTMAGSYQVHDGFTVNSGSKPRKHSTSQNSNPDADSETTDPVSLEDEDDDESIHSTPSTPMEDITQGHNREKFIKDTFENLSFTPSLPTDKFVKALDNEEEEIAANQPVSLIGSRLSLSARYLSRSQAANIKNMGMYNSIQRQDNWFDSVQRRRDDMARNLDESRRMLMAMGWKQDSPETDGEDPFSDPSAHPPSSTTPDNFETPTKVGRTLSEQEDDDRTPTNFKMELQDQPAPPPSPRTPKSLRRCWSTFDLPKTPIPEEKSEKKSCASKPLVQRSVSTTAVSKEKDKTPKKTGTSSTRPRSLMLDNNKSKPTEKNTKTQGISGRKATPTASQSKPLSEARIKSSRLSTPNLNRPEPKQENRRASSGTNLSKSKSVSMHSLRFVEEESNTTPTGKTRSKWAKPNLASFGSVPNLAASDDEEDFFKSPKLSKSTDSNSGSSDKTARNTRTSQAGRNKKTTPTNTNRKTPESSDPSRRSASTSRLLSGSTSRSNSVEEQKPQTKRTSSTASKERDRKLMPPPPVINLAKPEAKFLKRAQHNTRKSTSDLTLEQAKDILKGNSGILAGNLNMKRERSSSSSPPTQRSSASSEASVNSDNVGPITDPKILSVATEIEQTASELRRKSAPGQNFLPLDPSPNDLPERDIPPEHDIPKMSDNSASQANSNSRTVFEDDDLTRDSGLSTQEDEDCPSPSVKERIARLNKRTSDIRKHTSHSPYRDRYRSESPIPEVSPRQTSSVQISLGNTSSSSNDTVTSSGKTKSASSSQILPAEPCSNQSQSLDNINTNTSPRPSHSTSGQNLSPTSGLVSSLDSDGLANHLSPGCHSNTSPQSAADTGHGSDTDFDLNNSMSSSMGLFRRDHMPIDPATGLLKVIDQLETLFSKATDMYAQLKPRSDEKAVEAKSQFCARFPAMTKVLCDNVGISQSDSNRVRTEKYLELSDLTQKMNTIAADLIKMDQ